MHNLNITYKIYSLRSFRLLFFFIIFSYYYIFLPFTRAENCLLADPFQQGFTDPWLDNSDLSHHEHTHNHNYVLFVLKICNQNTCYQFSGIQIRRPNTVCPVTCSFLEKIVVYQSTRLLETISHKHKTDSEVSDPMKHCF